MHVTGDFAAAEDLVQDAVLAALQHWPVQPAPDERLRLIFTCCHPALPRPAQIALTLRVVCGLTTAQIARAFLVHETTVARRITRAKRKITGAGIPYRIPPTTSWAPA